jgi:hypothetical protein
MNLSQAVETFAGLDQKLVEIRASFQSLTTATAVQTVAMEGEAVATTSATVATTALGTAMKALPIIALVAGLATLVYGIYQYVSASDEADKTEKKRKANLEALKKAQDEQNKTIAKESAEYVSLIYQLKATNAGSEERKKLIKDINATYGTTLKNLSDEKAFQQQLNLEVANYIVYQKAKFQLQKNDELAQKNLQKQEELTKKLKDAQFALQLQQNILADFNKRPDPLGIEQQRDNVEAANDAVEKYKNELTAAQKRMEAYGKVNLNVNSVINEITGGTNKYTKATNDNTQAKDDNVEATDAQITAEKALEAQLDATNQQYTDTLKFIEDLVTISEIKTPTPKVIDDLQKIIDARKSLEGQDLKGAFKEVGIEVDVLGGNLKVVSDEISKTQDNFGLFYESVRKELSDGSIIKSVADFSILVDGIVNQAASKLSTGEITKEAFDALVGITDQYEKFNQLINTTPDIRKVFNNEELNKFFQTIKQVGIGEEIINYEKLEKDGKTFYKEITGFSVDLSKAQNEQAASIKKFQEELEKYYLSQIKTGEANFEQIVKNANLTEEQEKKLLEQKTTSKNEQIALIKEIAKAQAEGVANIVTTVTEEESTIRAFLAQLQTLRTENIGNTEELIKQTLLDNVDLLIEETQKVNAIVLDENKSARQNLLSFEEQIAKKGIDLTKYTEEEKLKIVQAYLDAQSTSESDRLEESLQNISDNLSAFQNIFSMFEESFTTYLEQQNQKRTAAIEDAYNLQLAALESNLAAGLIARESYDNQLEQLDQAQAQKKEALAREEFKKQKALNIVNATINGAQAVLSTFAGTPGGIVIKGIAAALAGIFAATQIALIARQEFTAADGGIVPGMGSGDIDSVPSSLAPGEAVINSKSTEAFLPLLSAINEMGGGRSFVPDLPATNQGQRFAPIFVDNERSREPIRAYVVESDISSAQKRVNRIERSTRF